MENRNTRLALRVSLLYGFIAALWIVFSDRIVIALFPDATAANRIQTYKGWGFVVVTAWLLYRILQGYLRRWEEEAVGRRQAQEALLASEAQYRAMFENAVEGFFQSTPEGRFVRVNPALADMCGYATPEEMISGIQDIAGQHYANPEDRDVFKRLMQEKGVVKNFEHEVLRKDGRSFWTSINTRAVKDDNHRILYYEGTHQDIDKRKKAERLLADAEEQYRSLFETSTNAIIIRNRDGIITMVNEAVLRLLGAGSADDLIGRPYLDFIHPEDRALSAERIEQVFETFTERHKSKAKDPKGILPREHRMVQLSGEIIHVESTGVAFPHKNEIFIQGIFRDITERKRAEEALQKSEEEAKRLSNENLILARIGRIISSTLNIDEVYDRFVEEVNRLVSFDGIAINIINYADSTVSVPYVSGVTVLGCEKGDVFSVEGSMTGKIMHSRGGMIEHLDDQEGYHTKFLTLQGAFDHGLRSVMAVPLISKDRVIGAMHLRSLTPRAYSQREMELAERVGLQIAGAIANAQLFDERKQAEEETARLQAQLNRSQKMEALGLLAGGVAHDLNNVLSGIVSYPDLLLLDLPPDSPLRGPILTIQKSGQKAASIVQDLLTLARRGVVFTEIINLNDLVWDYLRSPEHEKLITFHSDIKIKINLEEGLPNLEGSPIHLKKSIMNLISNAVEAQPNGGEVLIRTQSRYLDKPFKGYETIQEGDYAILSVQDKGVGISPEDLGRIFEPFYTKKVMGRSGTGLGMAVVWGTVQDHKGYIHVDSVLGEGTHFELSFPITRKEPSWEKTDILLESYQGHQESVLVVDDIFEQREISVRMLQRLGYRAIAVASGEEAVEYLKTDKADVLLLDMIMDPGMDGLETYKRILELHPNQKAVLASGFSETNRVYEAQKLGAGAYIKKPYTLEKLGEALKKELS
jgi:PAS domain S-box-containing protein